MSFTDTVAKISLRYDAQMILLEQQLSAMTKDRDGWKESCEDANTRFKASEHRIRESQEQKPVGWINKLNGDFTITGYEGHSQFDAAYKQPIVPPSLEELQRENADLTRKLAEQQSQNSFDATRLRGLVAFCGVAAPDSDEELLQVAGVVIGSCLRVLQSPETSMLDKSSEIGVLKHHLNCKNLQIENLISKAAAQQAVLSYLMDRFDNETWQCERCGHAEATATMDSADYLRKYLSTNSDEELTKLLEEAKQRAVPEGMVVLPTICPECGTKDIEYSRMCHNSKCNLYAMEYSVYEGWRGAPKPEGVDK